jgi:hypothetical protein
MNAIKFSIMCLAVFSFACRPLAAQEQETDIVSGKQVYVEMGGGGVLFSASFDSRFAHGETLGAGFRAGLGFGVYSRYLHDDGYYYGNMQTSSYVTIPVGINYIFGKKTSPHTFEIGMGVTALTRKVTLYTYDNGADDNGYVIGHASFMYRRQPRNGGVTWRIGFTPIVGTSGDIWPSGAVGIGYAF